MTPIVADLKAASDALQDVIGRAIHALANTAATPAAPALSDEDRTTITTVTATFQDMAAALAAALTPKA